MKTNKNDIESAIDNIQNFDIYEMTFGVGLYDLTMQFIYGGYEESIVTIKLIGIRAIKMLRCPLTEELPLLAGSIAYQRLVNSDEVTNTLNSNFSEIDSDSSLKTELAPLYYISIRGEIDLDIICKEVNLIS